MRGILLFPAAALALAGLAGCGSDGTGDDGVASVDNGAAASASASPTTSLSAEDARLKFEECMRDGGVKFKKSEKGGFTISGGPGDQKKVEAAMKKCQPLLQAGGLGPPNANDPAVRDKLVKYAQCMREHGVNMKDPGADGGLMVEGDGSGKRKGGPESDPKMKAADEACRHLLPEDPNGGERHESGPETKGGGA